MKASAPAPAPAALASITPPAPEPDDAGPVRLSIAGGVVRRALMRRDGATTISTIAAVPAGCDTDDLESVADTALLKCSARPEYDAGDALADDDANVGVVAQTNAQAFDLVVEGLFSSGPAR